MAEEEKPSEPMTDKYELQKLKVLSFSSVMFLLVATKNPLVCYSLHFSLNQRRVLTCVGLYILVSITTVSIGQGFISTLIVIKKNY